MEKPSLRLLLSQGEGQQLEYKQHIPSAAKIARTMVSLANTTGGTILVGVSDQGQVLGISPEEEKYVINKAAQNYCKPSIEPVFEVLRDEDGLEVLLVTIEESLVKPHHAFNEKGQGQVYWREEDQSRKASEQEVAFLLAEQEQREQIPDSNNELALFFYLEGHPSITVKDYAKLINSSRNKARYILERLHSFGYLLQRDRATYLPA